jgi:hypothetical protein
MNLCIYEYLLSIYSRNVAQQSHWATFCNSTTPRVLSSRTKVRSSWLVRLSCVSRVAAFVVVAFPFLASLKVFPFTLAFLRRTGVLLSQERAARRRPGAGPPRTDGAAQVPLLVPGVHAREGEAGHCGEPP